MAEKGRLIKESNPANPKNAGFIPQHDSDGNENYVGTSPANPLPTKDSDVKSELESIKQTQSEILDKLNGTIDTKLTGSNVEETVYERFLYNGQNSERDSFFKVPEFAKGVAAYLKVHGATGDYSNGKGLRVKMHQTTSGREIRGSFIHQLETARDSGSLVFYSYPGVNKGDVDNLDTAQERVELSIVSLPVFSNIFFRLYMDGSPDPSKDEGFDIEMRLTWLA